MASEFVGIELQLLGKEGVRRDLMELDRLLNSFRGRKKFDAGFNEARRELVAYRGELEMLQRRQREYAGEVKRTAKEAADAQKILDRALSNMNNPYAGSQSDRRRAAYEAAKQAEATRQAAREAEQAYSSNAQAIQKTREEIRLTTQKTREYAQASREAGKSFSQIFTTVSSRIAQVGSSMQSLGNALTKLTSPFERLTTGILFGAGYKMFGKFTEGLENGFERADIMRKFPRVMEAMGLDAGKKFAIGAGEAKTAIDNLNDSVLGLPTGLDEMVSMAQRFISTTGNLEKGTKLAIATNNAFLASMSTETQRYQGMMQLQDVIGGKDMNAREWMALANSMMPAIRMMGESLGYTGQALNDYVADVQSGKIANEDFVQTLIDAGSAADGKIRKVALEAMDTWEAFFSRIRTASSNLMYKGILEPMNELVNTLSGGKFKSVNLLLDDFIYNGINNMRDAVGDWIRSHPEEIVDFFNTLRKVDIKGFGKGLVQGLGEVAEVVKRIAQFFDGKDLTALGKYMVRMNMLGKGLTIFGGVLRGLRMPIGGIVATAIRGFRSFKRGGIFGALGDLIAGESLSSIGTTEKKIERTLPKLGKIGTGLNKFFRGWSQVATMIGGSALVAWGSTEAFKRAFGNIKEIGDIIADTDWSHAKWGLVGMGGFLAAFGGLSKYLGGAAGAGVLKGGGILAGLVTLFGAVFWADMELIKRGLTALKEATTLINDILTEISDIKDVGTVSYGNIDNAIKAFNKITQLFIGETNLETGQNEGGLLIFQKRFADSLQNLNDALADMDEIATNITKVNGLSFESDNIETVTTEMTTALNMIGRMVQNIPGVFKRQGTQNKSQILKTSIDNVISTFEAIIGKDGKSGLFNQIKDLNKRMTKLIEDGVFTDLQSNMDIISENMKQVWGKLNFTEGAVDAGSEESIRQGAQERFGKGGFQANGGISQLRNPTELILAQIQNLATAMLEIEGIITTIQQINAVEGLQGILDTVIGENGIIPQIQEMYNNLISEETGFGKGGSIDLADIANNFKVAVGSIKDAIVVLQEIEGIEFADKGGMGSVISSITTMVNDLVKAFDVELITTLQEQVETFKTQIETIKTTIQSLAGGEDGEGIAVDIVLNPTIEGDEETVKMLQDAHDDIETEIDAIKDLSQSIPLTFEISASLPGLEKAISDINSAASRLRTARNNLALAGGGGSIGAWTGGYIGRNGVQYRARGGQIFKRRGTDVIPAMLSHGEYVQSKRAVDFFGIDFMRKVNNRDIKGAMKELMAKAGGMANVGRGTVVTNNTYNNQKVTINGADISNAGYTFKRASRFAHAL